jgi:hypothetical protein
MTLAKLRLYSYPQRHLPLRGQCAAAAPTVAGSWPEMHGHGAAAGAVLRRRAALFDFCRLWAVTRRPE